MSLAAGLPCVPTFCVPSSQVLSYVDPSWVKFGAHFDPSRRATPPLTHYLARFLAFFLCFPLWFLAFLPQPPKKTRQTPDWPKTTPKSKDPWAHPGMYFQDIPKPEIQINSSIPAPSRAKPNNNISKTLFFGVFPRFSRCLRTSRPDHKIQQFDQTWTHLGAIFNLSSTYLGRSSGYLGPRWPLWARSWRVLGAMLGRLGAILGPSKRPYISHFMFKTS